MSSPARRPPRRVAGTRQRGSGPGSGTATPEGSATQTITSSIPPPHPDGLVLRLRGAHSPARTAEQSASDTEISHATGRRRRIQWAEDVVDNEGLGRKKSKVCCIFHKNREVGESSDEDDSSSSGSDSAGDSAGDDDGSARMAGARKSGRRGRRNGKKKDERDHEHGEDCAHGHGNGQERRPSPNAYERMPKYDVKPLERQPAK